VGSLREKFTGGVDHCFRGDETEAIVVPFRTDAAVTIFAGYVVEENTMGDAPGGMLRVGQGV
jgi:hypothetical protein